MKNEDELGAYSVFFIYGSACGIRADFDCKSVDFDSDPIILRNNAILSLSDNHGYLTIIFLEVKTT